MLTGASAIELGMNQATLVDEAKRFAKIGRPENTELFAKAANLPQRVFLGLMAEANDVAHIKALATERAAKELMEGKNISPELSFLLSLNADEAGTKAEAYLAAKEYYVALIDRVDKKIRQ